MKERSKPPFPQPVSAFFVPALISAMLLCGPVAPSVRAQDPAVPPAQDPAKPAQDPNTPTPAPTPQPPTADNGVLAVTVKEAATGAPIADAVVRIDGAKLAHTIDKRTDKYGIVTFTGLPEGTYQIFFQHIRYELTPKPKDPNLPAAEIMVKGTGTTYYTINTQIIEITAGGGGVLLVIDPGEVGNVTRRDRRFITEFPLNVGNSQSLPLVLRSVPGMVWDSLGQMHPKGENAANTAYYVDGILVPQTQVGRANQFWNANDTDAMTVRTGGFAAEYGGGSGAIVNLNLREPTALRPTIDYGLTIGGPDTRQLRFNYGSAFALRPGRRRGQPADPNAPVRILRYFFGWDSRYTNEALETPQPGSQNNFNDGASEMFLSKIAMDVAPGKTISALINLSSGRTNMARRMGLDDSFAPFGQGYGFLGLNSRASGLLNQQQVNQRIRQKDNNSLAALRYAAIMPNLTRVTAAIGASKSTQSFINFGTRDLSALPLASDFPIDYIPRTSYDTNVFFIQADAVPPPMMNGIHQFKAGFVFQSFDGTDAFQYMPQSKAALNSLIQLDPRLVPPGTIGGSGASVPLGSGYPAVIADRKGYYISLYGQDQFKLKIGMTINAGVRIDSYKQDITTKETTFGHSVGLGGSSKTELSPRLNLAWLLPNNRKAKLFAQPTILRVSYDHMFTPPIYGQGNFLRFLPGSAVDQGGGNITGVPVNTVTPQTVDQYEMSIERQLSRDKIAKIAIYSKDINRAIEPLQLLQGSQFGFLSVENVGNGVVSGASISFELRPPRDKKTSKELPGPYGYLVFDSSQAQPKDRFTTTNFGQIYGLRFYDHDQANTIDLGVAYRMKGGASAGLSLYYGSGLFASATRFPLSPVAVGGRQTVSQVDVKYVSGERFRMVGKRKMTLNFFGGVENLFNSKGRFDFRDDIAGTRYQLGTRFVIGINGHL